MIRAREHHPHLPRTEQQGSAVAGALLFKRVDGDMEANFGSRSSASLTPEEGKGRKRWFVRGSTSLHPSVVEGRSRAEPVNSWIDR